MVNRCECCGKLIENRPTGKPNFMLMHSKYGYQTIICIDCMMNRSDRVEKVRDANSTKTWKDMKSNEM